MTTTLALRRTISATLIVALLLLFPVAGGSSVRYNRTITIAAGTPVQISTTSRLARAVFIQMAINGSGYGAVMAGIYNNRTPSKTASTDLTAQLAPATAAAPGGSYSDANPLGIDLSTIWVDGSNTGDTVIVSYDQL